MIKKIMPRFFLQIGLNLIYKLIYKNLNYNYKTKKNIYDKYFPRITLIS